MNSLTRRYRKMRGQGNYFSIRSNMKESIRVVQLPIRCPCSLEASYLVPLRGVGYSYEYCLFYLYGSNSRVFDPPFRLLGVFNGIF